MHQNKVKYSCLHCGKPATLVNYTQFAGTHYWCDGCVPTEDRPDCTSLVCRSPYCECTPGECSQGRIDGRGSFPGEDHHSGDGGYSLGTREGYEAAVALRNKSLKIAEDTAKDLQQTTKQATERAVTTWADEQKTQYLLDKLQEEAAEIIQAVSKIRRFGPHNHHPQRQETNLQELTGELEDFQAIVWALEEIKYLDPKPSTVGVIRKFNTLFSS